MLRFSSTNEVLPGGPVSNVAGRTEIFGAAKIVNSINARLAFGRSTIAGARFLAGAFETPRRILQHSMPMGCGDCGLAGFEWNGQPVCVVCGLAAIALSAQ